jgi:hypothetical protein
MTSLSILILQLVLSFSMFIFLATWYVIPKIQTKDTEDLPFARSKLEPITRELRVIGGPINNCVVQGTFE